MVTGLEPGQEYSLARVGSRVRVAKGKGARADSGGVLWHALP
jgi:hypothetical protein